MITGASLRKLLLILCLKTFLKETHKYLPWLNQDIKSKMKERKKLYDEAKTTQLPKEWNAYRLTRNTVNVLQDTAHKNDCANLFTESFNN